jgi:hypothetical protein
MSNESSIFHFWEAVMLKQEALELFSLVGSCKSHISLNNNNLTLKLELLLSSKPKLILVNVVVIHYSSTKTGKTGP